MHRQIFALAFAVMAASPASATEAELAAIKAALPADIDGGKPTYEDISDVSETGDVTFVRFYAAPQGLIQIQVSLRPVETVDAEAQTMTDPQTLTAVNGKAVEIAGHKGSIISGVLNFYPGAPGEGLSITIGASEDAALLTRAAELLDVPALMAIR